MWCTTECWNCEDKTCEHYFSKQDIYFKYKKIESNWNTLFEYAKEHLEKAWDVVEQATWEEIMTEMNELEGE